MVLVDTSTWIEYLRHGDRGKAAGLRGLLRGGQTMTCGPVSAELMSGAREADREGLWRMLTALRWAALSRDAWRQAGEAATELRRSGKALPMTDIAIAVAAADASVPLWTLDSDFQRLAAVLDGLALYEAT